MDCFVIQQVKGLWLIIGLTFTDSRQIFSTTYKTSWQMLAFKGLDLKNLNLPKWVLPTVAAGGVVAVVVYIKAYRYVHEFRQVFKEMGLQELPERGWIGGWKHWMQSEDLFEVEIRLIKEYGKVFGYFEGRQPAIMAGDPELVKQVMIKDHEHFYDRRMFVLTDREDPASLGLTVLTGRRWKHIRQQLTPAFTPANLRRMEPLLMKVADQLIDNISKQADAGQSFDIKEFSGCFTLDAVASVAFALEIDSFNNPNSPFVTNVKKIFGSVNMNGKFLAAFLMFPGAFAWIFASLPKSSFAFLLETIRFFQRVVENEIERRKTTEQGVQRHDFLSLVIPLEKDPADPANKEFIEVDEHGSVWLRNGITRPELVAQAIIFFLAGYETTATTISMALFALSQNSDIQEKLHKELRKQFPEGSELTFDGLSEVKYLEMVINETLRFYTPLLRADRMCTGETVYNGMRIPKGVMAVIPINALHHDPDYWREPEKFDPERFSTENADSIPAGAFLPFGAGNRNCIGMRLALLELKLAIARLVLEFKFTLSPETKEQLPIRWLPTGLRTPHCPLKLVPEKRVSNQGTN